jgi:uncharacterized protein YkwD
VAQAGRIAQAKLVAAAVRSAEAEARTGPDEGTPSKATDPTPPPAGAPGQASGAAGAACPDTELIPASGNLDRVAASALCLINQQRASAGEPPLRRNAALTLAAGSYSLEMVTENFFGHVSPVGGGLLDRLRASGYVGPGQTLVGGENIDVAAGAGASPRASVDRWMNQSDHRANILNPAFRDSGIGVVAAIPALLAGGPGATYTNELGVLR